MVEVLTKNQGKTMIKEEVERKVRNELDIIWKHITKINDELKSLKSMVERI